MSKGEGGRVGGGRQSRARWQCKRRRWVPMLIELPTCLKLCW